MYPSIHPSLHGLCARRCPMSPHFFTIGEFLGYWAALVCYVIWLFVKRLSQEAIQRRSQRERLVKIKVFKLGRDADDIPCNITLRSAGGETFHSAGPTTAKAQFWDREVRDQGIRRSQRSAERSGREERADGGLDMSSYRYFGARPCWDLATRSRTLYLTRAKIGSQCSSLIM